jgi:hypothetical protein
MQSTTANELDSPAKKGRNASKARRWPVQVTPAKLCLAMAAMGQKETVVSELCKELGGHQPEEVARFV